MFVCQKHNCCQMKRPQLTHKSTLHKTRTHSRDRESPPMLNNPSMYCYTQRHHSYHFKFELNGFLDPANISRTCRKKPLSDEFLESWLKTIIWAICTPEVNHCVVRIEINLLMDAINLKIPQFVPLMTSLFVHLGFCYDDYIRDTATSHCYFCVETTLFF